MYIYGKGMRDIRAMRSYERGADHYLIMLMDGRNQIWSKVLWVEETKE